MGGTVAEWSKALLFREKINGSPPGRPGQTFIKLKKTLKKSCHFTKAHNLSEMPIIRANKGY